MKEYHRPVLLTEVIELLDPQPGGVYVDCTLGGGGHAKAILERVLPGGHLFGIDRDQDAIDRASDEFRQFESDVTLVRGNFAGLQEILRNLDIEAVDGVLFDLGVSSHQLDEAERGFSFSSDAPLDMRMDRRQQLTAANAVNELPEKELADVIYTYSDERFSRRIARAIVERRQTHPFRTTTELADIVKAAIPRKAWPEKIHPATRTFQSIRLFVNSEMDELEKGLVSAADVLKIGGKLAAISYHSIEHKKIKEFLAKGSGRCVCPPGLPICVCEARKYLKGLTRKPIVPTQEEIEANPRSRSAQLRVAEKIDVIRPGG
jgi:16S rRNA (cytosine1402-N4)-methyltransferase